MSKALLCPCEDVTLDDVQHAIDKGHRDIESIKRYTGFGTGLCQGKSCLAAVACVLSERAHAQPGAVLPSPPGRRSNRSSCRCWPPFRSTSHRGQAVACLRDSKLARMRCDPKPRCRGVLRWSSSAAESSG